MNLFIIIIIIKCVNTDVLYAPTKMNSETKVGISRPKYKVPS